MVSEPSARTEHRLQGYRSELVFQASPFGDAPFGFRSKESYPGPPGSEAPGSGSYSEGGAPEVFHLPLVCGTQTQRRVPSYPKPVSPQSLCLDSEIQASHPQLLEESYSPSCLDGKTGSSGRLLTHPGKSHFPEIHGLCPPRRPFSIPSSSFRTYFSPLHFHKGHAVLCQPSEETRGKYHRLPRRSDFLGSLDLRGKTGPASGPGNLRTPRFPFKSGKVCYQTFSKAGLARFLMGHSDLFFKFTKVVSRQIDLGSYKASCRETIFKTHSRKTSGSHGFCSPDPPSGSPPRPPAAQVPQTVGNCQPSSTHPHLSGSSSEHPLVDRRSESLNSCSDPGSPPHDSDFHRRVRVWLRGSQRFGRVFSRKMDRGAYVITYKWQRVEDHLHGSRLRSSSRTKFRCHIHRQQNELFRRKKQRLQQILGNTGYYQRYPAYSVKKRALPLPCLPQGSTERPGRRAVEGQGDSDGVGSDSSMFSGFAPSVGLDSPGRPDGVSGKHKVALLRLSISDARRSGNRLLQGGPGPLGAGIHLPASKPGPASPLQARSVQRKGAVHRPLPPAPALVSRSEGTIHPLPSSPRPTVPGSPGREGFSSIQRVLSSTRLGLLTSAYQKSFSQPIAGRLTKAFRDSTLQNYEGCWRSFQDFLRMRDYRDLSTSVVMEFLEFLFSDRNLNPRTILGYRNALSEPLRAAFQLSWPEDLFSKLARAHFLARPVTRRIMPNWDVSPILDRFSGPEFEASSCPLGDLLTKTIFLVALATGNRASELAAINRETIVFRQGQEILLPVKPNFLFKNQTLARSPPNISVKSFPDVDPSICPVRNLSTYLLRSKEGAKGNSLFLHPSTGRNLQRPSLALRITKLISDTCPGSLPKMHDLRKQASSLAWTRGVDPADIIGSAFWSSSSVFIKHYLFATRDSQLRCVALNRS